MFIPKKVAERIIHDNPYRIILEKDFLEKDNNIYTYLTISGHGTKEATMVFPMTEDGLIVLQKEFRVGSEEIVYQFPIGLLEENLNEIENCEKELAEETGYTGEAYTKIGRTILEYYYDAHVNYFFAKNCIAGTATPEIGENIEVMVVTPEQFKTMITDGTINCPYTLACYTLAKTKNCI